MRKNETIARILVIISILLAVGLPFSGYYLRRADEDVIEIHARMPENGGWDPDWIKVSVGQMVHLRLTSDDVVHSFAIGQSDTPVLDIYPGEVVETTIIFDKPGKYMFYCTRWCGPNHWRMRGTIEVEGPAPDGEEETQPLFLELGLDLDADRSMDAIPDQPPAAQRGAQWEDILPAYSMEAYTYLTNSPSQLWQELRSEPGLAELGDNDLWDSIAFIWQENTSAEHLVEGQRLYDINCAACHGETGRGDGVMVDHLSEVDPNETGQHGLVHPPDFSDAQILLSASPALLEGKTIRGGMGTGMPYWGPIFTDGQIKAIIGFLYTFVFQAQYE